MSIISKIDYKKIKTDKNIRIFFWIWLFFCILTIFTFYFQISIFSNVDVPTHIGAGLVISAFIYTTVKGKNGKEALALAFVPFVLWEFIEIGISAHVDSQFLYRLFEETRRNQIQDIVMDTLGFLIFMITTGRRF